MMSQFTVKPLNAVEENLQCGICLDTLRTAKTLPCLHSFCIECISKHIDCNEDHGSYKCPTCIHAHQVPDGGVHGLPTDFTKVELCRIVRQGKIANTKAQARGRMSPQGSMEQQEDGRASPRGCDICTALGKEESSHAVTACLDCTKMLCADCSEQHQTNEATKSHSMSDLKDQSSDVYCSKHNNSEDVLSHFCEPCSTFVCIICIHEDHADHPCLDMTSVEHSLRNRLIRTLKALNGDIKRLGGYVDYVEDYNKSIDLTKQEIEKRANYEKELVVMQREKLKREIDDEAQNRTDAIVAKEQDLLNRLNTLCADANKHMAQRDYVKASIESMTDVNNVVRRKLQGVDHDGNYTIESDRSIPELLDTGETLHDELELPSETSLIRAEFLPHNMQGSQFPQGSIQESQESTFAQIRFAEHNEVHLGELFVKQIIRNGISSSGNICNTSRGGSPVPARLRHHSGPAELKHMHSESNVFQPHSMLRENACSMDGYNMPGAKPTFADGYVNPNVNPNVGQCASQMDHSGPAFRTSADNMSGSPFKNSADSMVGSPFRTNADVPAFTFRSSTEHMDIAPVRFSLHHDVGSVSPSDTFIADDTCPWQFVVKYGQLYDDCFMALHRDERIVVFKKSRSVPLVDNSPQQWSVDYIRSPGHPLYEWLLQSVESRTNVLREHHHKDMIATLSTLIEEYDGNHSENSNDDNGW